MTRSEVKQTLLTLYLGGIYRIDNYIIRYLYGSLYEVKMILFKPVNHFPYWAHVRSRATMGEKVLALFLRVSAISMEDTIPASRWYADKTPFDKRESFLNYLRDIDLRSELGDEDAVIAVRDYELMGGLIEDTIKDLESSLYSIDNLSITVS